MKKVATIVMAAVLTASLPTFALAHGGSHDAADLQCEKECAMLLRDCGREVDTIQQKIGKLEAAIKQEEKAQRVADVRSLQQKLDDAKELLRNLEKGGH